MTEFSKDGKFEEFFEQKIEKIEVNLDKQKEIQREEVDIKTDERVIQRQENLEENPNAIERRQDGNDHCGGENQIPILEPRRGPGRPRIIRTGQRGRPRKIHRIVNVEINNEDSDEDSRDTEDQHESIEELDADEDEANLADISLKDALSGSEATEWMFAIKEEFKALINNVIWEIVDRPPGKNIIGCKIV